MRLSSPTGGALGNVSNFEVDTLQKTIGSLEIGQQTEHLLESIARIEKMYAEIIHGSDEWIRKHGYVPGKGMQPPRKAEKPKKSGEPKKSSQGKVRLRYNAATREMEPIE
jgi:hypothetical protein